ncbi:MAG: pimeloyl-ACP methyl ester esterase BioH [Cocleimonas sp.]
MSNKLLKTLLTGKEQGESLIVIHGWAMHSAVWQPIKADLEACYSVTWVDLPGHGFNHDVVAESLSDIVDLILPVLEKNSHLLGWSLGGLVAQGLLQRVPEKIKSITLVACTPRFSKAEGWQYAMGEAVLKNFAINLKEDSEATIKRFIGLQFMGVKNAKELQRTLTREIVANLPNRYALSTGLDILSTADFRSVSKENKSIPPQHWILAEKDRLVPKAVIRDLKLIRPDAQITLLENTGHAPFMTHPQEFMDSFTAFVDNYAG